MIEEESKEYRREERRFKEKGMAHRYFSKTITKIK
jgi:hypothetical protein